MNPPSHDDDATVIRPVGGPLPAHDAPTVFSPPPVTGAVPPSGAPSAAPPAADTGNALPIGSMLGEFEITRVLGEGGFGIVYLARDHALERLVALKEYMPSALALRGEQSQVMVRSERHRDTFAAGLKSFINEARLLAQFDHRSLVKVYRFWEANGTAFMVMPFIEGQTLKDTLRAHGQAPDEAWLMALLAPLTEALQVLHAENCFHRDIAPDNIILIAGTGLPLLLDFGAARRVIGDMTQALTVILKPGYAPIEQYAEVPSMKQGPWTDVYALAAVVYYAITGHTPPASVGRIVKDDYQPLATQAAGRYSDRLLRAVDRALQVLPDARTPSIAEFRADLGLSSFATAAEQATVIQQPLVRPPAAASSPAPASATTASGSSRKGLWLGLGLGALALAAAGAYFATGSRAPAPNATANTANPAATAPPPVATPAASPSPAPTAAAPAAPPAPADLLSQFKQLAAQGTPGFTVSAKAERTQLRIDADELRFEFTSNRDGHAQVLLVGPDGVLTQIYPNAKSGPGRVKAGQTVKLPQASWPLKASEPAGLEHFLVLVTAEARSYAGWALEKDPTYGFLTLPAKGPSVTPPDGKPWLLGLGDCSAKPCLHEFGAAVFSVEAVR